MTKEKIKTFEEILEETKKLCKHEPKENVEQYSPNSFVFLDFNGNEIVVSQRKMKDTITYYEVCIPHLDCYNPFPETDNLQKVFNYIKALKDCEE